MKMTHDHDVNCTLELTAKGALGPWRVEVGGSDGVSTVDLELRTPMTLGTSSSAGIRVADRTVSSLHCQLLADESCVEVMDLGSKNGLFVGGARVTRARLQQAPASFVVGRTTVTIRSRGPVEPAAACEALPGLVGSSEPMRRVAEEVRRHVSTRAPILIQGESGTGKDLVARAIHALGRADGPYVPLNVGAIAESLADSELFGHRRGAFTGAISHRQGAFELAHRGTLFLDEVAELSPAVQIRLLRVVEDGTVRPVGAQTSTRVDVRIVSASWAALPTRVEEGRFRADLYHRLSTVTVLLPPLRERRSDIPALAESLLLRMRSEIGPKQLSSGALSTLVAHTWPGNVRELGSVLYRAAAAATGVEIEAQHLSLNVVARVPRRAHDNGSFDARALLERHAGNVSAAARAARMPRTTFRALLVRGTLEGAAPS